MRKILFCAVWCMLVMVASAIAKPLPFLQEAELGEFSNPAEVYLALSTIPDNAVSKKAFLKEVKKNLNMTAEAFAQQMKDPDTVRVVSWEKGFPTLLTAGLQDGKVVYWREVNEGEKVVVIKIGIDWRPAFLLRCANPVKAGSVSTAGVKPQTPPAPTDTKETKETTSQIIRKGPMGCFQIGKTQVETTRPFYIENGGLFGDKEVVYLEQEYTYVKPVRCVSEGDYKKLESIQPQKIQK